MMKNEPKQGRHEFDREAMRHFMSLSVKQKLDHLDRLNAFFQKHMPSHSCEIWQKLKAKGF